MFFGIMHINIVNILLWSYFPTYFVNDENFLNIEPSPKKTVIHRKVMGFSSIIIPEFEMFSAELTNYLLKEI